MHLISHLFHPNLTVDIDHLQGQTMHITAYFIFQSFIWPVNPV